MKASALVLLSGGLDSSTLLGNAFEEGYAVRGAVFVNYGQRHLRERKSAVEVALHYNVPLTELDLTSFGAAVASALTTPGAEVPHGHYAQANMAQTVVPNRNAVMLSAAAGIAKTQLASVVLTAVHAGDHPIYPDCRPDFIDALSIATSLGCGVRILAPFVNWTKADIAKQAYHLQVPVHLTWSCYEGGNIHCGRCGTCVERAEAFHTARVPDPTFYADTDFWRKAVDA